jgi:hypothetical protein
MEGMNVYEALSHIQEELKAPKDKYNKFGNYYYRNAESILEAAKPVCKKYGCVCILSDDLVNIDGRFYVKATVTLQTFSGESLSVSAYAREDEAKKGMDGSQITGACSSYARKYALNGLFNIDDTKDADTDEYQQQTRQSQPKQNAKPQPPKPYVPQGEAPDYRKLCIRTWTAMGKDPAEIGTRFSVDRETTSDRWQQILAEMEQIRIKEANA